MVKLVNRAKMKVASGGAGTLTLGTACDGYQTFAAGGVTDQDKLRYTITDGNDWEIGIGTYTASGTTLARAVTESSNSGNAITCGSGAEIFVTMAAEDFTGNVAPQFLTTPPLRLELDIDGSSAVTLNAKAYDESGFPLHYSWDAYTTGSNTIYDSSSLPPQIASAPTIDQSTGVYSIVGSSSSSNAGNINFRIKSSDGVMTATHYTTLVLEFGYNLSGATYANKSFDVSAKEPSPRGLAFSVDGSSMYIVGSTNDRVYQFSLSTNFDVTTAVYSTAKSVSAQASTPFEIRFSSDGYHMYVLCSTNNRIYQYDSPTAFNANHADYELTFDPTANATDPFGFCLSEDGSRLLVVSKSQKAIYQYNLTVDFVLSSAAYSGNSLDVSSQMNNPISATLTVSGTKLFVLDNSSSAVFQYQMSSANDLSTATYSNKSFSLTSQGTGSRQTVEFSRDGSSMYIMDLTNDKIWQYST